jgi:hypothetical protein
MNKVADDGRSLGHFQGRRGNKQFTAVHPKVIFSLPASLLNARKIVREGRNLTHETQVVTLPASVAATS